MYSLIFPPFNYMQRSPFKNAGTSIAKVLSMTTGNFDYDNTFRQDSSGESDFEEELPFLPVTYILWITFVILMPLLLNNLLVCSYKESISMNMMAYIIVGWPSNRRHKIR